MSIEKQTTSKTANDLNTTTNKFFNTLLNNEVAKVVKNIDIELDKRATLGQYSYTYQHSNMIESIDRAGLIERVTKYYQDLNYVVNKIIDANALTILWDKPTKVAQ